MTDRVNAPSIARLSPETLEDFLAFFDGDAFSDNPAWSSCYCQCFYEDHTRIDWPARTAAVNRECAVQRCASGSMQGYLAYSRGRVVGWCSAAPRHSFHALDHEPIRESEKIGCVLCFLVAPQARGQGIAKSLLQAACEGLRAQGLVYAEANPRPQAQTSADNHFGPLTMYLAAGFSVERKDDDGSVWVRKRL
jgi:GNAT superfamily N-acetyltransferase